MKRPSELLLKAKKELLAGRALNRTFFLTGIPNFYQEALWLLSDTLKKEPSDLLADSVRVTAQSEKIFWEKIEKRRQAFPLEYLLKSKTFLNHLFYVEEGVFIPRKETEILAQRVFKQYPKQKALKIIDAGSGAGTIALSLLSYFPKSECLAFELDSLAIKCLIKNSRTFKVHSRLKILKKDFSQACLKDLESRDPLKSEGKAVVDLITANPPYIDFKDQSLDPSVYWFEPPLALFSDKKGMGHIVSWFKTALPLLKSGGVYIFEFGWNQKKQVIDFLEGREEIRSYEILGDQNPRSALCFKKDG